MHIAFPDDLLHRSVAADTIARIDTYSVFIASDRMLPDQESAQMGLCRSPAHRHQPDICRLTSTIPMRRDINRLDGGGRERGRCPGPYPGTFEEYVRDEVEPVAYGELALDTLDGLTPRRFGKLVAGLRVRAMRAQEERAHTIAWTTAPHVRRPKQPSEILGRPTVDLEREMRRGMRARNAKKKGGA